MTKHNKPIFDLDVEEKSLSDSFDRGEWRSVRDLKKQVKNARDAATNYLRKAAKINI